MAPRGLSRAPEAWMRGSTVAAAVVAAAVAVAAAGQAPDPTIATLAARVDLARMHGDVQALVDFGTRRSDQPGGRAAQDWVADRLLGLGYPVELHDYDANADNVVATLPGLIAPGEVHVLGAHYDSVNGSGATLAAPGADDNASGTAGLIEVARILASSGVRFEATITFVAFAAEEFGRVGSSAFVAAEQAAGRAPADGVILDVLGYLDPGSTLNVAIGTSALIPGIEALRDTAAAAVETYLPLVPWEFGLGCT
jgi:leucyl aminopeptidase